ncbi:stage II sporulation protein M [Paenibacillus yanchengensis]|uniref:Stage II sporulation protein M n=1 Tax=Paenibacillus yanchengensis TaxID=2035833 RepID=A0ABW4YH53_9BACL
MFKWQAIKQHFKEMRTYIGVSIVLFLAGTFVGATDHSFASFLDGQLAGLEQLSDAISQSKNVALVSFLIIFLNNAVKAVITIYLGAFFAWFPISFLTINGMVLGYMFQKIAEEKSMSVAFEVYAKGILPHGWIEIPVIIVAAAYGVRFGVLMMQLVIHSIFSRSKLKQTLNNLRYFLIRSVPVAILVVVFLLIAAIIESTLTPLILSI